MIHLICPNPAIDRTLLVKEFKSEFPNRPYEVKEFPGGKGFNVAYAIGFEEPEVDYCVHTILGGKNGEYLKELADKRKIPLNDLKTEHNTRICTIIMDTTCKQHYLIYENSFQLHKTLLDSFTQQLWQSVSVNDIVVFSGSLMKGMPSSYIADTIKECKNKDVKVFVDTSGEALVEAFQAKPFAIKINDEELLDLVSNQTLTTIEEYVQLFKSGFAKDIPFFIITLGARGIIAKINQSILHLKAPTVIAKNPIASGDFFLGALVKFSVLESDTLISLKKALSYSTANVLNWYPELNSSDIKTFFDQLIMQYY